jgi:hypothetical protein
MFFDKLRTSWLRREAFDKLRLTGIGCQTRSKIVAIPWPIPMHIVARA